MVSILQYPQAAPAHWTALAQIQTTIKTTYEGGRRKAARRHQPPIPPSLLNKLFSARAIRETRRVVRVKVELIMMVEGMGGVMGGGSL